MEVQSLKNEIADEYIKKFKDELGWLKSLAILPIESKIKDIIVSNKDTGATLKDMEGFGFWKDLITFLSPSTAEKIYDFIKEKKEILAIKKTKEELEMLKEEVVTGKKPPEVKENTSANPPVVPPSTEKNIKENIEDKNSPKEDEKKYSSARNGIVVGLTGGTAFRSGANSLEKVSQRKLASVEVQTEKTKALLQDVVDKLKNESVNPNYTAKMQKNFLHTAEGYEKTIKGLDNETMSAVTARGKLGDKLPNDALKTLDISDKVSDALKNIDKPTLEEIAKLKTPEEIKKLLKSRGVVEEIPDDILKYLSKADNVGDVSGIVEIFSHTKGLKAVMKGIKTIGFLDVAFMGFDVYQLCENLNEAELIAKVNEIRASNKRTQAWFHMKTAVSSFLVEAGIIWACVASGGTIGGPLGVAIGMGVGVLFYSVDEAADTLYFDTRDFFLQNKEEYIKQQRTEIKQAILQTSNNLKYGDNSLNESIVSIVGDIPDSQKIKTLQDAWEALIYLEEYDETENGALKYPLLFGYKNSGQVEAEYLKVLTPIQQKEYNTQKVDMQKRIDARMKYIAASYNQQKIFAALKTSNGLYYVAKIASESKAYIAIQSANLRDDTLDFEKNKEKYRQEMLAKSASDQEKYKKIDVIYQADKNKFWELYKGAMYYEPQTKSIGETDPDYQEFKIILDNIGCIKKYYEYVSFGVPEECNISIGDFSFSELDYNYIHTTLLNLDTTINTTKNLTAEQAKSFFLLNQYKQNFESTIEISESPGQNFIYRIAKEVHGYTGRNDMKELIAYFSPEKKNTNGMYFDEKWYLNDDRSRDMAIDINELDSIKDLTETNVDQKVDGIIKKWLYKDNTHTDAKTGLTVGDITRKQFIDTKTEGIDSILMDEMEKEMRSILKDELSYRAKDKKKSVEGEIIKFIQTKSTSITGDQKVKQESGYIQLPFYLLIAAKRTGIGDLQKYLFKNENGKIVACTLKTYVQESLNFSETKTIIQKEYIFGVEEKYGENMGLYITDIDATKNEFEKLITYVNPDQGGLGIPSEYLKIFRKKINEWENFKQSLLLLDNTTAKIALKDKYQERHDYFENMYLGMLKVLSDSSGVAKLDSNADLTKVEGTAQSLGSVRINAQGSVEGIKELLNEDQNIVFNKIFASQKINGKTISKLAKSFEGDDKEKALWATKQLIKSLLEGWVVVFMDNGSISNIYPDKPRQLDTLAPKNEKQDKYLRYVQERLKINLDEKKYISAQKNPMKPKEDVDMSKVQIKKITENQSVITNKTNAIQKIIEETKSDDVYIARGNIKFDVDTDMLKSWSNEVKIDTEGLKIIGLNITFTTLEQLVYAANLVNRFKYKYPNINTFSFGSRLGIQRGIYNNSTRVVSLDAIKKNISSVLDSENNVQQSFIDFINKGA